MEFSVEPGEALPSLITYLPITLQTAVLLKVFTCSSNSHCLVWSLRASGRYLLYFSSLSLGLQWQVGLEEQIPNALLFSLPTTSRTALSTRNTMQAMLSCFIL